MEATIRDMQRRLDGLERASVRYRQGVVSGTAPLAVEVGGGAALRGVRFTGDAAHLIAGDPVALLSWGRDLLAVGKLGAGGIPEVAALPRGVADGHEVHLREPTQGVLWHVRYQASSRRWWILGGGNFLAVGAGGAPGSAYSSWQALGAATFAVPFTGNYEVEVQALLTNSVAGVNDVVAGIGPITGGVTRDMGRIVANGQWCGGITRYVAIVSLVAGATMQTLSVSASNLAYGIGAPTIRAQPRWLAG